MSFSLPGSAVEFDSGTTNWGWTACDADLRSAWRITLDGNSCGDTESVHIHVKSASVLSVKKVEVSAAAEMSQNG